MAARPLLARPTARFACFGDGLCCTDIHALGPVTPREHAALVALAPDAAGAVVRNPRLRVLALAVTPSGGCTRLGEGGCTLHAAHGPASKPASCRRFPYGLVATPDGGRVTTAHRCPCRTMGLRPLLDLADAARSLAPLGGRLRVNTRAGRDLRVTADARIAFDAYKVHEAAALASLDDADDVPAALDRLADLVGPTLRAAVAHDALPTLGDLPWLEVAYRYRGMVDGTRCGAALAWFGDALVAHLGEARVPLRARPWSAAFDRAEARATSPSDAAGDRALADWVADALWALPFATEGALGSSLAEVAVRADLARALSATLRRAGVRADRAMAEAILVVELGGAVPLWREVTARIGRGQTAPPPSRAAARLPPPIA